MSLFPSKDPSEMPWNESQHPQAVGCFSKKLYVYDTANLGRDGVAGSYTTLYKIVAGGAYPPIQVIHGALEITVLKGSLQINSKPLATSMWIQLTPSEGTVALSSIDGCEILAIVRGELRTMK
jgi:hypothetical protein